MDRSKQNKPLLVFSINCCIDSNKLLSVAEDGHQMKKKHFTNASGVNELVDPLF